MADLIQSEGEYDPTAFEAPEITDEDRLIATGLLMYLKMIKDKVEQDAMNSEGDL